MKKFFSIAIMLMAVVAAGAQTDFRHISLDEAAKAAKAEGKLIFIDVYTSWCGPCKMMAPVLEDLKQRVGDKARIVKVDVDKNQSLAMEYGIQAVPTLILFSGGAEVWRQSGAMPVSALEDVMKSHF